MPTIQIPTTELLRAVQQLGPEELDTFATEVLALRNQRHGPLLGDIEEHLLALARQKLPEKAQLRYTELREKLRAGSMTQEENAELLRITTQAEQLNVIRVQALGMLGRLRNLTVPQVLEQLQIEPLPYE
jgi:hypothetical protein